MADEILRADADITREQALKVERREADRVGGIFQGRLVQIIRAQEPDGAAHAAPIGVVFVEGDHVAHGRKMALHPALFDPFLAHHALRHQVRTVASSSVAKSKRPTKAKAPANSMGTSLAKKPASPGRSFKMSVKGKPCRARPIRAATRALKTSMPAPRAKPRMRNLFNQAVMLRSRFQPDCGGRCAMRS